ncbi:DUF3592 domain-containing protein [Mesorhizobium mediterraneum]|uniref:DUF3592 domain-containing protein n=1 Tax=Mesorhizobium mediterraneum TaxID=43617 RepID=UPI003D7E02BE
MLIPSSKGRREKEWITIILVLFLSSRAIAVFIFVLATIQENRFAAKAISWLVVESRVVDRLTAAPDPVTYDIRVSYLFDGKKYNSVARNFYRKETTNKHVGDTVLIKVNPRKPDECVLFS